MCWRLDSDTVFDGYTQGHDDGQPASPKVEFAMIQGELFQYEPLNWHGR